VKRVRGFVWGPAVFGLAAIGGGFAVQPVREHVVVEGRHQNLNIAETHASASLLGQFRTSISGWLWARTDLYLHNGVVMRPLTEAELQLGKKGQGAHAHDHDDIHEEMNVTTEIPNAEHDFRGIFGDIDRATKAYKDMTGHDHQNPKQALPLFRLMTWIDPYFIDGWTTGASVYAMGKNREGYEHAEKFLRQGLVHNPDSISILNQLGFTYLARLKDYPKAQFAFEQSIEKSRKLRVEMLTEGDQDSLEVSYRFLALVYRDTGQLEKMYSLLREGLKRYPHDTPMARMINTPPAFLAPKPKAKP